MPFRNKNIKSHINAKFAINVPILTAKRTLSTNRCLVDIPENIYRLNSVWEHLKAIWFSTALIVSMLAMTAKMALLLKSMKTKILRSEKEMPLS